VVISLLLLLVLLYVFAAKIVDNIQVERKRISKYNDPDRSINPNQNSAARYFFMGLWLLILHLPSFLSNALFWFKAKAIENPYEYVQTGNYWLVSLFNLIIGYVFVTNAYRIAHWVVKGQEKR